MVALSGGVDSAVSACLLMEQGYAVTGMHMRTGYGWRSTSTCDKIAERAMRDAEGVAKQLGIAFEVVDLSKQFEEIIEYFVSEYANGRTPNPCIKCNMKVKFGAILEYAKNSGVDFLATGHYARLTQEAGVVWLRRGVDPVKDQSYFLFAVASDALGSVLFPVGGLSKNQVRAEAARFDLHVEERPDSMEVCFAPDSDYVRVIKERTPEVFRTGNVVDGEGKVIGTHNGVANFTIGQRRGLGIAAGQPVYVSQLDSTTNTVVLDNKNALYSRSLLAEEAVFPDSGPTEPIRCTAKIRYQAKDAWCTAVCPSPGMLRVDFDEPQLAITPGQAVVLYHEDTVLGGGWIRQCIRE